MNTYTHSHFPGTLRRVSAETGVHSAATTPQAARLAALGVQGFSRAEAPAPLWDNGLLGRLTVPLSRLRE